MAQLAEHEERAIRERVSSHSPVDDKAGLVQRISAKPILPRTQIFDVYRASTRPALGRQPHCAEWFIESEP